MSAGEQIKKGGGNTAYFKVSQVNVGGVEVGQEVGNTLKEAIDMILEAPYVAPSFSSFSANAPLNTSDVELGYRIPEGTNLQFNFNISNRKNAKENTLKAVIYNDGQQFLMLENAPLPVLPNSSGNFNFMLGDGQNIMHNTPTTVSSIIYAKEDRNDQLFSKIFTKSWKSTTYITTSDSTIIDENFIKSFNQKGLVNSHGTSVSANAGNTTAKYLYYAYPQRFGFVRFVTLLGVELGSLVAQDIEVRTDSQITNGLPGELYAVCRTANAFTGTITRTLELI